MSIAVTDRITRGTDNISPFAVAWEDDLKLSHVTVADITARDAIPEWKRISYMTCYVVSTSKIYRLGNDTTLAGQVWTEETFGVPDDVVVEGDIFDENGFIKAELIQNVFLNDSYVVDDEAAMLALSTRTGNFIIRTDSGDVYVKLNNDDPSDISDFALITYPGAVLSVNGDTGVVVVTITDLIDDDPSGFNTKVSASAVVTALSGTVASHTSSISSITSALSSKADLVSGTVPLSQLPYVFSNAITRSTNSVKLGGLMTEHTTIDGNATYNLILQDIQNLSFSVSEFNFVYDDTVNSFSLTADGADALRYTSDLSPWFTNHSLITKQYTDQRILSSTMADPGVDSIVFWDESVNGIRWLTLGTGLQIIGTEITATGDGGAVNFLGLEDTPDDYTGQGLKYIRVKSDELGLEFITPPYWALSGNSTLSGEVGIGATEGLVIYGVEGVGNYIDIGNSAATWGTFLSLPSVGSRSYIIGGSTVAYISIVESTLSATFIDNRVSKKGLEYNATGYVTQLHSLTDKEYVDAAVISIGASNFWKITGTSLLTGDVTIDGDANQYGVTFDNIGAPGFNVFSNGGVLLVDSSANGLSLQGNGAAGVYIGAGATDVGDIQIQAQDLIILDSQNDTVFTFGGSDRMKVNSLGAELTSTLAQHFGANSTDGTWRIIRSSDDLLFERRESGVYITKFTVDDIASGNNYWKVIGNTTLSGASTIIGTSSNTLKFKFDGLNTTQTNGAGLWLANTTAAAAGSQQISPSLTLEGQGWRTNATAESESVKFTQYVLPVQGAANPTGNLLWQSSINNGAYITNLSLSSSSSGTILFGSSQTSGIRDANGGGLRIGGMAGSSLAIVFVDNSDAVRYATFRSTGTLFHANDSDTITANTRLDIRGVSGGNSLRLASNANTQTLLITDDGTTVTFNTSTLFNISGTNSQLIMSGTSSQIRTQSWRGASTSVTQTISTGDAANGIILSNYQGSNITTSQTTVATSYTFSPSSGTASFVHYLAGGTYNTSVSYVGTAIGFDFNPTTTGVVGLTNIAFRSTSGQSFFANALADTITANTRLDIRGISSGNILRLAGNANQAYWTFSDAGQLTLSSTSQSSVITQSSSYIIDANGASPILFRANSSAGTNLNFVLSLAPNSSNNLYTNTTGTLSVLQNNGTFQVSSGSANMSYFSSSPTLNQTGATGIIRGYYWNPTVTSVSGSHFSWDSTAGLMRVSQTDSGTNTVLECLRLERVTSGTAATGLGVQQSFYLETTGGTSAEAAKIVTLWQTAGSQIPDTIFSTNTGVSVDVIKYNTNGVSLLGGVMVSNLSTLPTADRLFHVSYDNNNTGTEYVAKFTKTRTSASGFVDNIGVGLEFEVETADTNKEIGGLIDVIVTDRTSTAENFAIVFKTMVAGAAAAERLRIHSNNVGFFGAASFGSGSGVIGVKNATTAPTASLTDGILLYAEDVSSSSELKVRDEAGNITTLSPHNFTLIGEPSEDMAWSYYSERELNTKKKRINVDMLAVIREVEKLVGRKLVFEDEIDI